MPSDLLSPLGEPCHSGARKGDKTPSPFDVAKGKTLGRKRLLEIGSLFTPDTILRWHRKLVAEKHSHPRKSSGRPPLDERSLTSTQLSALRCLTNDACCACIGLARHIPRFRCSNVIPSSEIHAVSASTSTVNHRINTSFDYFDRTRCDRMNNRSPY